MNLLAVLTRCLKAPNKRVLLFNFKNVINFINENLTLLSPLLGAD